MLTKTGVDEEELRGKPLYNPLFLSVTAERSSKLLIERIFEQMGKQNWKTGQRFQGRSYRFPTGEVSPLGALIPVEWYRSWHDDLPVYSNVFWQYMKIFPPTFVGILEDFEEIFYLSKDSKEMKSLFRGVCLINNLEVFPKEEQNSCCGGMNQ